MAAAKPVGGSVTAGSQYTVRLMWAAETLLCSAKGMDDISNVADVLVTLNDMELVIVLFVKMLEDSFLRFPLGGK